MGGEVVWWCMGHLEKEGFVSRISVVIMDKEGKTCTTLMQQEQQI